MKKVIYTLILLCIASCNDIKIPGVPVMDPPELLASTPANGAESVPKGDITIVLTYNQNVFCPTAGHARITLGSATITSVSAELSKLTIQATGLQEGETYQLIVPADVVQGPTYAGAPEHSISFTVAAPVPVVSSLCSASPTPEAVKLYDYLVANYRSKVISGTMANVNWNTEEAERVFTLTGKYPAINTFDYIHVNAEWIDYDDISPVKNWWDAGGLVSAMWHWNVPVGEGSSEYAFYKDNNAFDAANATVAGTWENDVFTAGLAKVAASLKQLQDEHIAVIWRPFHEAAGGWFWWGRDATSFKALWVAMFEYFQAEGVNNLIWVWTTETDDDDWYPGDEYVDIVGRDLYDKNTNAAYEEYVAIDAAYPDRIIALSECGAVGLISEQWAAGALWSWFMPWYGNSSGGDPHGTDAWWMDAMSQDFVITREDVNIH